MVYVSNIYFIYHSLNQSIDTIIVKGQTTKKTLPRSNRYSSYLQHTWNHYEFRAKTRLIDISPEIDLELLYLA